MNDLTEREIQNQSVKALRKLGYTVCVTSNGKKTANTVGTPDVFVWHDRLHFKTELAKTTVQYAGHWLALEFKTPTGKLSMQQQLLLEGNAIVVCRSLDDTLKAVGVK